MSDTPPAKLYKYQPFSEQTLENLRNRVLWFSYPREFNDPFDCNINFKVTGINQTNLNILFDEVRKLVINKEKFYAEFYQEGKIKSEFKHYILNNSYLATEEIINQLSLYGLSCFSETFNNILMWSHYAEGHRGLCLEFDTTYPPFKQTERESIYKVDYPRRNSYPLLSLRDILGISAPSLLKTILTTKSYSWRYEKEWRIFHEPGHYAFQYDKAALTAIYFGNRMSHADRDTIYSAFKDSPTICYDLLRSGKKFTLIPKPFQQNVIFVYPK